MSDEKKHTIRRTWANIDNRIKSANSLVPSIEKYRLRSNAAGHEEGQERSLPAMNSPLVMSHDIVSDYAKYCMSY